MLRGDSKETSGRNPGFNPNMVEELTHFSTGLDDAGLTQRTGATSFAAWLASDCR